MTENRYANGKIYKIVSEKSDKVYIGSTCKKLLSQRLAGHKNDYKRWKAGRKHKMTSFDLIELGDVSIILLELFPCNTKDELLSRERHYIELYKNDMINKIIPIRTSDEIQDRIFNANKEHYKNNKDKILKQTKEYYENNKNDILKNMREKAQIKIKCECGSMISKEAKVRHERTKKHTTFTEIKL